MAGCCQLVGDLYVGDYIISVQVKSNTEINKSGTSIILGPTLGSVSISAYATKSIHTGCPGRAGVSLNWLRKYDCDKDELHFIFLGSGKSFISGDVEDLVSVSNGVVNYPILNASATSGPTGFYEHTTQTDGFGLSYKGKPYSFNTGSEGEVSIPLDGIGPGTGYLQSFALQCVPGQVPTVNYNIVFTMTN